MKSTVSGNMQREGLEEILSRARQALDTSSFVRRAKKEQPEVDVISNDSMSCLRMGVSTSLSARACVIRIENYSSGLANENSTASILFYNYGIACYMLAKNTKGHLKRTPHPKTTGYFKMAVRLLRISHSICSKAVEQGSSESSDRFQDLHVMGLVLRALSCCLGPRTGDAKPYLLMLTNLQKVLDGTHETILSDCPTASAAA